MTDSLLVLSSDDVAHLIPLISLGTLLQSTAQTMHAISNSVPPSSTSQNPEMNTKSGEVITGVRGIQNPARIATETERHKYLYMPSRLSTEEVVSTAVKVVAVPKASGPPGLPASTLLFDESTGRCRAIVNAGDLTGLRTATASALATNLLAIPNAQRTVIFGSGVQAYYHATLIPPLFQNSLGVTLIVRSDTERSRALLDRLTKENPKLKIECLIAGSPEAIAAVGAADVICCCTPSKEPVFEIAQLKPSVHVNAIGSYTPEMTEFPPSLLQTHIRTVLVDSRSACLAEAGEIIASGVDSTQMIELGELVDKSGSMVNGFESLRARLRNDEIWRGGEGRGERLREGMSLFKCVGSGGMDVAITELIVTEAMERGMGTRVPY